MKKVMVSIVGDQPAPNLFLIKDSNFSEVDSYLFITTALMEERNKYDQLIKAVNISKDRIQKITIEPHDLITLYRKLTALQLEQDNVRYLVNISSGSKIMSVGVYAFFTQVGFDSKIYYLSIAEKGYWQIYPLGEYQSFDFQSEVSLEEYWTSYEVHFEENVSNTKLCRASKYTADYLQQYLKRDHLYTIKKEKMSYFLRQIREATNEDRSATIPISNLDEVGAFLKEIDFQTKEEDYINPEEAQYLTGGWWEEWVYTKLKQKFQLTDNHIALNVSILSRPGKEQVKNEFDVQFLYQNKLHIIECKSGMDNNYKRVLKWLKPSIYKLRAVRQNFGLNVQLAILTLADFKKAEKRKFQDRARELDILLLDQKDLFDSPDAWIDRLIE
jgi:hypothetical protein